MAAFRALFIFVILFATGCSASHRRPPVPSAIQALHGRPTLLFFWATWCPSCMNELPQFIDLARQFPRGEVGIVGVGTDDSREALQTMINGYRLKMPIIIDRHREVANYYGISALPTVIILDSRGQVVRFPDPKDGASATRFVGERRWNQKGVIRGLRAIDATSAGQYPR